MTSGYSVPVSKLPKSLEFFDSNDWRDAFSKDPDQVTYHLLSASAPMRKIFDHSTVAFVWVFRNTRKNSKHSRVPVSLRFVYSKLGIYKVAYERIDALASLCIPFSDGHFGNIDAKECHDRFGKLLKSATRNKLKTFFGEFPNYEFYFDEFEDEKYSCCIMFDFCEFREGSATVRALSEIDARVALEVQNNEIISKIIDYYKLQDSLLKNIPWESIFHEIKENEERTSEFFIKPRYFNPSEKKEGDKFLWPWQRSLEYSGICNLEHKAIDTVSLVCDLRNSTVSMLEFDPPESYAEFLDEIVSAARAICLANDGYFDKETGDGMVAHFCGTEAGIGDELTDLSYAAHKSLIAAKQLVISANTIISRYQRKLKIELDGLGLSIGIHLDKSTWMCTGGQIRAIGPSVVRAARLCDDAITNEILISPPIYRLACLENKAGDEHDVWSRRQVKLKEIPDEAKPMAYSLEVKYECN